MAQRILTICVPSYNRLEQARRCVRSLLGQVDGSVVEIMVLDNGSDQDYAEAFAAEAAFRGAVEDGSLILRRNPSNIGMSANFLRAYEVADGDWLWLVSDDDDIRPDAVSTILGAIDAHGPESGFIKFSSPRSRPDREIVRLRTLEEFIDFNAVSAHAFNGFIFISNGIYRLANFRPLLGVGYQYANTFVPHFMMLTAYMAQGNCCTVSRDEIIDYVVPQVGYSYGMVAGLGVGAPKHALLQVNPRYYRKFLGLFFPHNDFKVIIDLFYQCKRDASPYVCGHLSNCYLSYVSIARGIPRMLLLRCFSLLTRFPWGFERLVSLAGKLNRKVGVHVSEIKSRYS